MNYANGKKYVGEWKGDLMHGQGTLTLPNNLLTGISTYQLYKINKQTKGLIE